MTFAARPPRAPARRAALPGAAFWLVAAGLVLGLGGGAGPALADLAADRLAQNPTPGVPCRCRANGRRYELGERACIDTANGPRMARCRLVQNVTSWAVESEGCEVSGLGGVTAAPPRGG